MLRRNLEKGISLPNPALFENRYFFLNEPNIVRPPFEIIFFGGYFTETVTKERGALLDIVNVGTHHFL